MDRKIIGDRIRFHRKKLGLTQEQLASKLFISESFLTLIEKGKRSLSLEILDKLSQIFNVTTDYLIYGDIPDTNDNLFNEWHLLTRDRSKEEIKNALDILKKFFDCVDNLKNK